MYFGDFLPFCILSGEINPYCEDLQFSVLSDPSACTVAGFCPLVPHNAFDFHLSLCPSKITTV